MAVNRYARSVFVLSATLLITAPAVTFLYIILDILLPDRISGVGVGIALFLAGCSFAVNCMRSLATIFLYEKADRADLQALGGVRVGGYDDVIFCGKGATWPFAKLSASRKEIRLQSPFGDYRWDRYDPRLILRRVSVSAWKIGARNAGPQSVVFFSLPWQAKAIDQKLSELGYLQRP